MVMFLFGVSISINVMFIGLWVYGVYLDRKNNREAQQLLKTHLMSSEMYKNWMYEA